MAVILLVAALPSRWLAAGEMTQLVFEVPVSVQNASPMVASVAASCTVQFSSGDEAMGMPPRVVLGPGGSLEQVFRVEVSFLPGALLSGGSMIATQSDVSFDP